ncbi:hypothetical protein J2S00_000210 [Caldalkalibacillus uzonensis]|uniref:Zorya protein ZorC EH domain-containing protein n=1 Tax=Caldalkalibacillus uzonensis TaxID=353224 RepID=A0ABU0CPL3_9BACI|nr:hypothetical protein [Caldalkalibacillus uzonensis]MDQ0337440.1 hypothetical protein [Caldalkalibacillus uzonensis]
MPQQTAWVQLGKFKVLARLEVPLSTGQSEWFQVQAVSRPVILKLIHDSSYDTTPRRNTDQDWQPLLRWLGISDTPSNRQLVQLFVSHHLPLNRSVFQQVQETLALVGRGEKQQQAVLLALQNGWPPSPGIVRAIDMFLHQPNLKESIAQLMGMVGEDEREVLQALLFRLPVHQFSAGQLKDYFQRLSLHLPTSAAQETAPNQLTLSVLLQNWIKDTTLNQSARKQAENILYQLAGQHLLMQGDSALPVSFMVFHLLVRQHGRPDSVYGELQGYTNQKGKISSEHCRLLIYVNLQRLGETCVDVQVQNRWVSIKLFNDLIQQSWLDQYKPAIKKGLASHQYKLSSLVAKEWQVLRRAPDQAKPSLIWGHYQGVDIRI